MSLLKRLLAGVLFWIVVFAGLEAALRVCLFSKNFEVKKLRQAYLYADYNTSEWWRLNRIFVKAYAPASKALAEVHFDPELGWTKKITSANPLGIEEIPGYSVTQKRKVLFFGDSYVHGETEPEDRLTSILSRLRPEYQFLNYGVEGYGLDQIYLRFKRSHRQFEKPVILFGILPDDLPRCLLAYRGSPKPFFTLKNGALEFHRPDNRHIHSETKSYLWAYITRFWARARLPFYREAAKEMESRAKEISARLLEEAMAEAKNRNLEILFVLFGETKEDWDYFFLRDFFESKKYPFVDVRSALEQEAKRTGASLDSYYGATWHPTAEANRIAAAVIAEKMADMGLGTSLA